MSYVFWCSNPAGEHNSVERLRGALEVTVSSLVDRAFATQAAYVQCAASLSKQMQALTSLNTHLMNVCQVQHFSSMPRLYLSTRYPPKWFGTPRVIPSFQRSLSQYA